MRFLPVLFSFIVLMAVASAVEQRPNIIVFLVDDMGVMDTPLLFLTDSTGKPQRHPLNDYYRTPSMERLAARGIRFNNFCAMSVCSPSRISLMTGQNAARHRTTNWINPDQDNRGPNGPPDWNWQGPGKEAVTLPSLLRTNGYRTIHVGKGHFGPPGFDGADPTNLGFVINVAGRLHQRSRELFCHPALRPPAEPQKQEKSPVRQSGGAGFGEISRPGNLPHRSSHP